MREGSDAEIYEKHAEELTRFATFLVGADEAADVVSGAVLGALTSPAWRAVENPRAYLFRAVLNRARMTARKDQRRRRYEARAHVDEQTLEPVLPDPAVVAAVASLSERQRAVIYLAYWDDLTPAAISSLLGISEGSTRRHLARARRTLRSKLDHE